MLGLQFFRRAFPECFFRLFPVLFCFASRPAVILPEMPGERRDFIMRGWNNCLVHKIILYS